MKNVLSVDVLLPILFPVIGAFIILWLCYWLFKKQKLLLVPYGGMEWSQLLFVGSVFLGLLFICSSFVEPMFQTYKTLKGQQQGFRTLFSGCFEKFSEFFLICLVVITIYLVIILLLLKLFPGQKAAQKELQQGNLSVAIMMTAIAIGFSLVFKEMSNQILQSMTPYVINFR